MGQNASMEGNPLMSATTRDEQGALRSIGEDNTSEKESKIEEEGQDSSTDSDMKTNSVRAAIDSLIESCLGVKSDESEAEDSKKDSEEAKAKASPPQAAARDGGSQPVDVVFSFMKDRIVDMIKSDTTEEVTNRIPSVDLAINCKHESKPLTSEKSQTCTRPSLYESLKRDDKLPKNTVRLQTLIDKVLDNSLGEDMHTSLPDVSHKGQVSMKSLAQSTATTESTTTVSTPSSTSSDTSVVASVKEKKRSPEMENLQNNMVCLMDHIERVLEKSFVNEEISTSNPEPVNTISVPKETTNAGSGSITQGKPVTSASANAGLDGTISVQDIVDRVISQTEVISKLLSPGSSDEVLIENHGTPSDSKKGYTHEHARDSERLQHRSPVPGASKSPSRYSDAGSSIHTDGHSETHRNWSQKPPQDGYHGLHSKHMPVDKVKEPKQYEPSGYSVGKYATMAKQNEAMMARFNPRALAPYLNGAIPRQGMLPKAQMYMLRGHPMYMPPRAFPPPLMRADGVLASENDASSFSHMPSKNCRCLSCRTFFQYGEKSTKQSKPSPNSASPMMNMPMSQAEPSFYQNHLQVPVQSPHSQGMIVKQDMARLQATSPSKFPNTTAVHMANMIQYPVQPIKPLPYPATLSHGVQMVGDAYNPDMAKSDRRQDRGSSHARQDIYHHNEGSPYSCKDFPRNADNAPQPGRHGQPPVASIGSRQDVMHAPKPHVSLPPHGRGERYASPQAPVLDLTVKIPESVPIAQPGPDLMDNDQPLDLSKKPSNPASVPRDVGHREGGGIVHGQVDYSGRGNHHLQHLESSVDKLFQQAHCGYPRKDMMPFDRGGGENPGNAIMAPTIVSGMMMSPGGHRPQLHPIPAPTFSTTPSTMSALSPVRPANQVSISHAQGQATYPSITQEKLSPKTSTSVTYLSQTSTHQLRESPQPLASPQGSEKGDLSQRKGSVSRHEPIQSIIGNHPPNDILYLICRLCRQTYGSPYGFRKHFRNQHGFEPRAEHTIVQTISATKSALQSPYMLNPQDHQGEPLIPTGRSSAPPEREAVSTPGSDFYRGKKESLSPLDPRGVSPSQQTQQDWNNSKARAYRRASDGRPKSSLRDDCEDTKYLQCQQCNQTFQLNDFGSYKRHCRQHNQARTPGPFIGPESHLGDSPSGLEQNEKHLGRTGLCRFCGCQFSVLALEEHVKSVHFKEMCSDGQPPQAKKPHSSSISNPTSPEGHTQFIDSGVGKSIPEFHKFLSEPVPNPNLEVQRLPADQITVSASPDSSSDKPSQSDYTHPTSTTTSQASCPHDSNTGVDRPKQDQASNDKNNDSNCVDSKARELMYLHVEDDKDSGFSGERCSSSESRSLSIESTQDGGPLASPAEGDDPQANFYRHKKFGSHRKRKESCENPESESKVPKLDQSSGAISKEKGPCAQSSGKEEKPDTPLSTDDSGKRPDKEVVSETPKKTGAKQEARHQLPFVWDRVTRIQAGKNIKPPDYMT
ncbi:uncharacterized protein LOC124152124 [Haliotis rufescens]|uniref:uncharacterized protein LOC124152124 n=1 Tax=Haliotis rufescens TaxID=6454 RepID=UPI00201F1827|nr:uncharacterized protein LOC124152124 [Haliotis rufescens]